MCAAYEQAVPIIRQSSGNVESRIIGGKEAAKGQFPYQAAVTLDDNNFCGGSLISKKWILTAGHCVKSVVKWTVSLGAHNIRDLFEPGRVTLTSNKAILHEEFNTRLLKNDVALVELPQDLQLSGMSYFSFLLCALTNYRPAMPFGNRKNCFRLSFQFGIVTI